MHATVLFVLRCLLTASWALPMVAAASTSKTKAATNHHPTTLTPREMFRRSISDSSGDIFFLTERYNFLLDPSHFDQQNFHASHIKTKDGVIELPPHADMTHGYAWDYDVRIPLAFYDPSGQWFKTGTYTNLAVQQDIAPTLADVLGIAAPDRAEGRVLSEARKPASSKKPKLMVLIVQDQMGWQYFDAHPNKMPFLRSLFKRSALFTNAQVAHVDVETAPGHAAIGTGAYPRGHSISANNRWQTGLWSAHPVFVGRFSDTMTSDEFPLQLTAATLADVWLQSQGNRPEIFSLCSAARASVSLGGHGSLFNKNKKTAVVYYSEKGEAAGTFSADKSFYKVPTSIEGKSVVPYAEKLLTQAGGKWFGNSLRKKDGTIDFTSVRATPAMVDFENDLVLGAVDELKLGTHDTTDLLFLNFKSSDYCGHFFGYESEECATVVERIDEVIAQLVAKLEKTTEGDILVAVTADHGGPPLPELSGGVRLDKNTLQIDLNTKFSEPNSAVPVVSFVGASQLWLNRPELARRGYKVSDVIDFLRKYEVPMAPPWNMLAEQWRNKGKPAKIRLFRDVVSREELLK